MRGDGNQFLGPSLAVGHPDSHARAPWAYPVWVVIPNLVAVVLLSTALNTILGATSSISTLQTVMCARMFDGQCSHPAWPHNGMPLTICTIDSPHKSLHSPSYHCPLPAPPTADVGERCPKST